MLFSLKQEASASIGGGTFTSLWDKGFAHVIKGDISLEELLSCIEPDEELISQAADFENQVNNAKEGYFSRRRK